MRNKNIKQFQLMIKNKKISNGKEFEKYVTKYKLLINKDNTIQSRRKYFIKKRKDLLDFLQLALDNDAKIECVI